MKPIRHPSKKKRRPQMVLLRHQMRLQRQTRDRDWSAIGVRVVLPFVKREVTPASIFERMISYAMKFDR